MKTGIINSVIENGVEYLIDKPRCGDKIRLNGNPQTVVMLDTYVCISGLPTPKARKLRVGDRWEVVE